MIGLRMILAFAMAFLELDNNVYCKDSCSASDSSSNKIKLVPTSMSEYELYWKKRNYHFADKTSYGDMLDFFTMIIRFDDRNALWCGAEINIDSWASDETKGIMQNVINGIDKCCRAHDNCSEFIDVGKSMGTLLNNGVFIRYNCSCEREFYDCLNNEQSDEAHYIGRTYFNVLELSCFSYKLDDSGRPAASRIR